MTGVDLSHYQDGLNLALLKNGGYSFAILKLSEGRGLFDSAFDRFYDMATANGIPVGAYVYSHATSAVIAKEEASYALRMLKGRSLPLGIYMDIETTTQLQITKSQLLETAKAFQAVITEAGYKFGIYSSEYGAWSRFTPEDFKDDAIIWVAHYGQKPKIYCDLWQKSDKGAFPGFYGAVDVDEVISDRFAEMVEPTQGESSVSPKEDRFWDWKIANIQIPMKEDGYWPYEIDGHKSKTFFDALDSYVADIKNC